MCPRIGTILFSLTPKWHLRRHQLSRKNRLWQTVGREQISASTAEWLAKNESRDFGPVATGHPLAGSVGLIGFGRLLANQFPDVRRPERRLAARHRDSDWTAAKAPAVSESIGVQ